MPSPNKSNKIGSKSQGAGRKDRGAGSKVGKGANKKVGKAETKMAEPKIRTAAKAAAASVKSSKPAIDAGAKAGSKTNKNAPAVSGSTTSVKGGKSQPAKVKSVASVGPAKAVSSKPPASKAAAAKPVRSAKAAPVVSQPVRQKSAVAPVVKTAGKLEAKAAGGTSAGLKSNKSEASKKSIVTNKKATKEVNPATAGKAKHDAKPVAAVAKAAAAAPKSSAKAPLKAPSQPAQAEKTAVKPISSKPAPEKVKAANDSMPAPVKAVAPKAEAVKSDAPKPEAVKVVAPTPVASPVAAQPAVKPVGPVVGANGVRINPPYRPAVTPAMAKPVTKPGVPHAGFKAGEFIVYPAHGVGQIVAIEEQEVAGFKLELFVIDFVKDKMTLKVPMPKVLAGAIRKLSSPEAVKKALDTLTGRARIKRTMWSRRAQEYEAKINSGDLVTIAEVVRDLYRSDAQPEQSYSERQLYEAAVDRMAREVAAVQKLTEQESLKLIEQHLQRGPRRGAKAEADAADESADAVVDEAA